MNRTFTSRNIYTQDLPKKLLMTVEGEGLSHPNSCPEVWHPPGWWEIIEFKGGKVRRECSHPWYVPLWHRPEGWRGYDYDGPLTVMAVNVLLHQPFRFRSSTNGNGVHILTPHHHVLDLTDDQTRAAITEARGYEWFWARKNGQPAKEWTEAKGQMDVIRLYGWNRRSFGRRMSRKKVMNMKYRRKRK